MTIAAGAATAQGWDDRWGVGLEGGLWKQMGGDNDYSNVDQFGSLKIRHGLDSRWTLDIGLKYGWFRPGVDTPGEDAGFTFDKAGRLYTRTWQPNLTGTYRFADDGTWRPWVSIGAGVTRWDVRDLTDESSVGFWPKGEGIDVYDEDGELVNAHGVNVTGIVGLGTEIVASENWSFDVGVRYDLLLNQSRDSVGLSSPLVWDDADEADVNKGILEGVVGINYYFGNSDRDGDGIPNDRDAAPNEPEDFDGFRDEDGAPDPDNDGDGVLDAADGAPNDPEDRDGFQDADGVPDPDNDGDGVLDSADGAPDEPEDRDGFQDADGVPDPDNDGDGVLDAKDQCANTPAGVAVDANGCPIAEEIVATVVLEGVTFKTGSAELTPESAARLDKTVESAKAYPEITIEVGGHTDSQGAAEANQKLSQERAESVRNYLIVKGIAAERITAVGYGEDYPIADNATAAGRAANRRVEIKRTDK